MSSEPEILAALASIDTFDFDAPKLNQWTYGRPLSHVLYSVLHRNGLVERCNIDDNLLRAFIMECEAGYLPNAYHNHLHAADVVQTTHYYMCEEGGRLGSFFTPHERLALFLAAAIHDIGHPGVNNNFLIQTEDSLAITYNDTSVLENYHCACGFRILQRIPLLNGLPDTLRRQVRKLMISLILATDMMQHSALLSEFRVATERGLHMDRDSDRHLLLRIILKCADISNPTKPRDISAYWQRAITTEFYRQGDAELSHPMLGVGKISPFMNRNKHFQRFKCQSSFINYIVQPLFQTFVSAVESIIGETPIRQALDNLNTNLELANFNIRDTAASQIQAWWFTIKSAVQHPVRRSLGYILNKHVTSPATATKFLHKLGITRTTLKKVVLPRASPEHTEPEQKRAPRSPPRRAPVTSSTFSLIQLAYKSRSAPPLTHTNSPGSGSSEGGSASRP
eukprot:gnl/Spiro4/23044_TR11387_c0_g1_i1.p1 gnl/Spiro4/23044_TR11387_c0_g1~~gnl/Spiro4/23044_TR11387_c0_g1_i1.p1  ORF type:complete len:452 (+),score=86.43 gnl/Spiro4/23044_TR11387_c0_g1_i1:658-2013(+)